MTGVSKMPCDDCVHLGTRHADPAHAIIGKCLWSGPSVNMPITTTTPPPSMFDGSAKSIMRRSTCTVSIERHRKADIAMHASHDGVPWGYAAYAWVLCPQRALSDQRYCPEGSLPRATHDGI